MKDRSDDPSYHEQYPNEDQHLVWATRNKKKPKIYHKLNLKNPALS